MRVSQKDASQFFDKKSSDSYDTRFKKIGAVTDNLHLLIRILLDDMPPNANILCVGVGTGTEILTLAQAHPGWTFTGVDPAASMLDVAQEKIEAAGIKDRCTLVHGYVSDVAAAENFDAVLCLLVTHFLTNEKERQAIFDAMAARLKKGGTLITADISGDTASPQFQDIFEKWKTMHKFAGAAEDRLEKIREDLQNHVSVLPPASIEEFYRNSGFALPVLFFQSLLIRGWYARK